jgi:hypothetical protein
MKTRLCFLLSLLGTATLLAEGRTWTLEAKGDLAPLATKDFVRIKGDDGKMVTVWRTNLQFQGELVALATNKIALVKQPDGKQSQVNVPLGWTNLQSGAGAVGTPLDTVHIIVRGETGELFPLKAPLTSTNVQATGTLVGFVTNRMVIIKQTNGDLFQQVVTDLVSADRAYIAQFEALLPKIQLDREILEFAKKGYIQITNRSTIDVLPGVLAGNHCWMDTEFISLNPVSLEDPPMELGFTVRDKAGVLFDKCRVPKDGRKDVDVLKLQRGDRVRLVGVIVLFPVGMDEEGNPRFDTGEAEFRIEKVEMIQSAEQQP